MELGHIDLDDAEERGGVYAVEGTLKDKLKYFQSGAAKKREGADFARSDSRRRVRKSSVASPPSVTPSAGASATQTPTVPSSSGSPPWPRRLSHKSSSITAVIDI